MVTVAPWGTVTGLGGSPEAWCCRWTQPHSSGGTQLPFCCSRPWKTHNSHERRTGAVTVFLFVQMYTKTKKTSFPLYLWYNSQSIYYMLLTVQAKTKTRVKYAFMLQLVIILTFRATIRDVSLKLYYQRTKWKENNQLLLALWSFMVSCLLFSSPAHNFNAVFIG